VPIKPDLVVPSFRILRDDGACDAITGQSFASHDEAHAVLERYYAGRRDAVTLVMLANVS
jgi:hypothetical protein